MVMGSINEVVRLMKLTETLYKRLANEAMEANGSNSNINGATKRW